MHPIDHKSLASVHCSPPKITSGALYYRVFITEEWWSWSYVAPTIKINKLRKNIK